MEKYKYCPHCSQPLDDDGSCPGCSYGHKRQQSTKKSVRPRLCAFNDHGEPCHQVGYLSQTTHGEGPWYCQGHFARIMKWPVRPETGRKPLSIAVEEITRGLKEPYRSRAIARQSLTVDGEEPMSEVDKRVNKLVPRLTGESEHDWSMRCKDWVLTRINLGAALSREPGDDEQEAA